MVSAKSASIFNVLAVYRHVSGVLKVQMDDGTELECRPGDVSLIPAGHDA